MVAEIIYTLHFVILLLAQSMMSMFAQKCHVIHFTEEFVKVLMLLLLALFYPLSFQQSATKFNSISPHSIMNGCVAAFYGWLCHICIPSQK